MHIDDSDSGSTIDYKWYTFYQGKKSLTSWSLSYLVHFTSLLPNFEITVLRRPFLLLYP